MTEPARSSIDDSVDMEVDTTPADTASKISALQNQPVVNVATETLLTPAITSSHNWILYLPPELRMMIYRYVLKLHFAISYYLPFLPHVQVVTGILHTSSLIRRESICVFYRENTFSIHP